MRLSVPSQPARAIVIGLFRAVTGLLIACHGAAELYGVLTGPVGGHIPHFAAWPDWWAAAIELVGGGLLVIGLATRPAALVCSGSMAYAYFSVHQEQGLWPIQNGGELATLYSWAFLILVAVGPGALALDGLVASWWSRQNRRGEARRATASPAQ